LQTCSGKICENSWFSTYNVSKYASGGDILSSHPNKETIIEKITISVRERYAQMTENERKEKHGMSGDTNPNWRGGKKNLCPQCGVKIAYYAKTCQSCRDQHGEKNPFYGHTHTQETKRKIRENHLGKKPTNMRPVLINKQKYESVTEASKQLNVCKATIIFRIYSKNKNFSGYFYIG
jgi:hypothetical protein